MLPRRAVFEDPPDMLISLRLKYGVHTVFLLVDPLAPFATITTELLSVLRDRNSKGLCAAAGARPTLLPKGGDFHVSYGVLKNPHDETKGWNTLEINGDETPANMGLKNNTMVAFVIRPADEADESPDFVVQWPRLEEEEEEEEEDEDQQQMESVEDTNGMDESEDGES